MPTDKQRRDAQRRRHERQQQRRGQQEQVRRRRNLIFSIVGVLAVVGVVVGLLVATHGGDSTAGANVASADVDPVPTNPAAPASSSASSA